MQSILSQAQELLGSPARIEEQRGWAVFWCPFHKDADRSGQGGRPNFGINFHSETGYWKCLRCGAAGPSLQALKKKLGVWQPQRLDKIIIRRSPSRTDLLDEAVAEARSALLGSPARAYLRSRGIRPYTALLYGLGYGLPRPNVRRETEAAARESRLVAASGTWLWSGGLVYADPLVHPVTLQVRHLRKDIDKKYQTWGRLAQPLGAWRLNSATQVIVVIEGLFDMLSFAQALQDRGLKNITPVFTGGATVSWAMRSWFKTQSQYAYLLLPDPDQAGEQWTQAIGDAIRSGKGITSVARPPSGLDPDEALQTGWWPENL